MMREEARSDRLTFVDRMSVVRMYFTSVRMSASII
jgi:hypothetical protein